MKNVKAELIKATREHAAMSINKSRLSFLALPVSFRLQPIWRTERNNVEGAIIETINNPKRGDTSWKK